jgi:hypothetical protein
MIWNLSCRKTRRLLALRAGNDLEERDGAFAQRHVAVCPSCREVWLGLTASQQALEQLRAAPIEAAEQRPTSVWPAVARHIRSIDEQAAPTWRGWIPAAALAAACLAVVMVVIPDAPFGNATADNGSPAVIFSPSPVEGRLMHRAQFDSKSRDLAPPSFDSRPDGNGDAREPERDRPMRIRNVPDDRRSF